MFLPLFVHTENVCCFSQFHFQTFNKNTLTPLSVGLLLKRIPINKQKVKILTKPEALENY